MNTTTKDPDHQLNTIFLSVALFWSILISMLAVWDYWEFYSSTLMTVRYAANESYNKDLVYRRWAAMHGGVYVPITPETPPNPYLAHIPERDISTPSGKKLTLINPAYMTRQVHEIGVKEYGIHGHITSLKPIRPENAPDEWERKALQAFERDRQEVWSIEPLGNETFFRLMHPLITEPGCLKCHAEQGYKVGDIRGGISVSVPWAPFRETLWAQLRVIILAYGGIWVIGILGLYLSRRHLQNYLHERKRAEEALRESQDRFHSLFDLAPLGYQSLDEEGCFIEVNHAWLETLGYNREEVIGKWFGEFLASEFVDTFRERFPQFKAKGKIHSEFQMIHKNGSRRFIAFEGRIAYKPDMSFKQTHCILSDITDRKRAEEALKASEERHRTLFKSSRDALMTLAPPSWRFTSGNPATIEMFEVRDEATFTAFGPWDLSPEFQPDGRSSSEKAIEMIETAMAKGSHFFEWIARRPGGVSFPAAVLLTRMEIGGQALLQCTVRDITDRVRAEEEKRSLEERLHRAEKMEALGQLAGGVAHDLNNVLGVSTIYSELLQEKIPEESPLRKYVDNIFASTQKGAAIIEDLLTLARRGVAASEVMNLSSIVSNFLKAPEFQKIQENHPHVTFRTECQDDLLNIKGSPVHLEKTLMNLVSNAAEAISGKGEVTIRIENRYLDNPVRSYDEVKQGDYVVLTVSDTGMGIPAENRNKIFEPFYTKKTMGRSGTGLGLAIVWGTVKDHNGYIDLQTEVGEGTTFTLYFPVTRKELLAQPQKVPIEQYMGKGGSVLVVDDIAEQRDIASRLLGRLGYEVHTVSSGEEAVEYLTGKKADILVLDMIMAPGIDGLETYQRILEINPKQKAILVSGFSETDRVREAQKLGAGAYVKKPYIMETIGVAIRDELERK